MNKRLTLIMLALLLAFVPAAVAQTTYEQLTSIADIDESALYVLGVEDIGFHYSGTSSWGNVALPSEETPIYYTLFKAQDGTSFTAQATIGEETLYLKIVNSNNFKMSTSATDTTNLVIVATSMPLLANSSPTAASASTAHWVCGHTTIRKVTRPTSTRW